MLGHGPLSRAALSTLVAAAAFDVLPPGAQLTTPTPRVARYALVGQTLPTDDAIPAIRPVDTGTGRPVYVRFPHRTFTGDGIRDAVPALPPGTRETPSARPVPVGPRTWTWEGNAFAAPEAVPQGVSETARPRLRPPVQPAWTTDGNAFTATEPLPQGARGTAQAAPIRPVPRGWLLDGNVFAAPEPVPSGASEAPRPPQRLAQPRTVAEDAATTLLLQPGPPGAQEAPAPGLARRTAPWTLQNLPPPPPEVAEPLPPNPGPPPPPPPRAARYAAVGESRPGDDGTAPPTPLPDGASSNVRPVPAYAVVRGPMANVLDLLVQLPPSLPPGQASSDRPVRPRPLILDAVFWYIQEAAPPIGASATVPPAAARRYGSALVTRPTLVLDTAPPAMPPGSAQAAPPPRLAPLVVAGHGVSPRDVDAAPAPALPPGAALALPPPVRGPLVVAGHGVAARDVDAAPPQPLPPGVGVSLAGPPPRPRLVIVGYDVEMPDEPAPFVPGVPAPPAGRGPTPRTLAVGSPLPILTTIPAVLPVGASATGRPAPRAVVVGLQRADGAVPTPLFVLPPPPVPIGAQLYVYRPPAPPFLAARAFTQDANRDGLGVVVPPLNLWDTPLPVVTVSPYDGTGPTPAGDSLWANPAVPPPPSSPYD